MSSFQLIRAQLRQLHFSSEIGRACIRFISILLFQIYLLAEHNIGHTDHFVRVAPVLTVYLGFSFIWIGVVSFAAFTPGIRSVSSGIMDHGLFACLLFRGDEVMMLMMWAPVMVAIGNGVYFGVWFGHLSSLMAAMFIGIALASSPFWRSIPYFSVGYLLFIIIIPQYAIKSAELIAKAKRDLELRAANLKLAAQTDSLTGILNRSGFEHALQELAANMKSKGTKGAVMYLDLDGFKAINDTCGHGTGDEVLKEVASRLQACLRISDRLARIGGDEFGILVGNLVTDQNVERLAQKILDSIGEIRVASRPHLQLGASIGICIFSGAETANPEAILEVADGLMYQVKKAGKNQFRTMAL